MIRKFGVPINITSRKKDKNNWDLRKDSNYKDGYLNEKNSALQYLHVSRKQTLWCIVTTMLIN